MNVRILSSSEKHSFDIFLRIKCNLCVNLVIILSKKHSLYASFCTCQGHFRDFEPAVPSARISYKSSQKDLSLTILFIMVIRYKCLSLLKQKFHRAETSCVLFTKICQEPQTVTGTEQTLNKYLKFSFNDRYTSYIIFF